MGRPPRKDHRAACPFRMKESLPPRIKAAAIELKEQPCEIIEKAVEEYLAKHLKR